MSWTILKLLRRKPKLPFPPRGLDIQPAEISDGAAILFLRKKGNWMTQDVGQNIYGFPYEPYFHAGLMVDEGRVMNVGLTTKVAVNIEELYSSTARIDVVLYPGLTPEQISAINSYAYSRVGQFYDWGGFLNFGTRYIAFLRHFIRPSASANFCSELTAAAHLAAGHPVSLQPPSETAPWDLYTWAAANPDKAQIRTLFVGPEFGT